MATSFTDLGTVKGVLEMPTSVTKHDAKLNASLAAAEAAVLTCLGLTAVDVTTYTVGTDADRRAEGYDLIEVGPRPIVAVSEVKSGGQVLASTEWHKIGTYLIKRHSGMWCGTRQNGVWPFEATLTAGFDEVPGDLAYGVAEWAAVIYAKVPGVESERIGRYQVKFTDPRSVGLPPWPSMLDLALSRYSDPFGGYVPIALPVS